MAEVAEQLEKLNSFIDKALQKPMSYLLLSEKEVGKLVTERTSKLEEFGRALDGDLGRAFVGAADISRAIEQLLKVFVKGIDEVLELRKYTDADLFAFAHGKLRRLQDSSEESAQMPLEWRRESNEVEQQVAHMLAADPQLGQDPKRFAILLEQTFATDQGLQITSAKFAAASLIQTKNYLGSLRGLAEFSVVNGLICRGMFCRVILQGQGGQHAASEKAAYFHDKAGDVFLEVITSCIPFIGEYITKFKLALDLAIRAMSEGAVLREAAENLRKHTEIAQSFITVYTLALMTWVEWAHKIVEHQNNLFQDFYAEALGKT
ncbi:hypothetical protein [Acidisphaera sp. S103]|uniref:hypothetical protein n=1 Tax=Acidisphaera sp. S103 TaxID=1747223 RepID=UPI00131AD038|nr:hypothetical protein [Acidisphaera sp. S103]